MAEEVKRKVRCAIYTRKSSDENLNSDFTSLDAQRESGEAYIKSQQSEGWELYPERYDDPGYSGGDMQRPALQRLLCDSRHHKFDIVVVYKVDRLTRSLKDFTKIIEVFDNAGASFVAVTQQFNTSTSMGRLTLNVLLSFAQFEREIIGERTRDKRKASAEKGKWLGGYPVVGYDIDFEKKKLVVNQDEVPLAREMFQTYLSEKSLSKAAHILNKKMRTKQWIGKNGRKRGGSKFNVVNLSGYLHNPVYIGQIRYKGKWYKGEHQAIIDERLFDRVQKVLDKNREKRTSLNQDKHDFLLRGLVRCVCCGSMMTPNFSYSRGSKYFYYKCVSVQKLDRTTCKVRSVPARELENIVVDRLKYLSGSGKLLDKIVEKARTFTSDMLPQLRTEQSAQLGDLRKIKEEAGNLVSILAAAGVNGQQNRFLMDRLANLEERSQVIEARLNQINLEIERCQNRQIDAAVVKENLRVFKDVFDNLTPNEKKELLRILIVNVYYDLDCSKIRLNLRPLADIIDPVTVNLLEASLEPSKSLAGGGALLKNHCFDDNTSRAAFYREGLEQTKPITPLKLLFLLFGHML